MQRFIGLALMVPEIIMGVPKDPPGPLNGKIAGLNRVNDLETPASTLTSQQNHFSCQKVCPDCCKLLIVKGKATSIELTKVSL